MEVQQAAFDKILPGVQARCAVFFYFGGGWGPTFSFFKSLDINMVYTLEIQLYIFSTSRYLDGEEKPKKTNDKDQNKKKRKDKRIRKTKS